MFRETRVHRPTLVKYAGLLGRGSLAAAALERYDEEKSQGRRVAILMHNNGFRIRVWSAAGVPTTFNY